jgi:hypothetical protein
MRYREVSFSHFEAAPGVRSLWLRFYVSNQVAGALTREQPSPGEFRARSCTMVWGHRGTVGRLAGVLIVASTAIGSQPAQALQDVPVLPPPPGPGGCRGPACATPAIPRDEIVTSLPAPADKQGADPGIVDVPLIDSSSLDIQLGSLDEGVTSGADSSSWAVESVNGYETCTGSQATQSGQTSGVCDTGQPKQEKPPK